MSTFVYMTRCDGCGHCVDICPSDIMHIDENIRRAKNIEPNFCWECYSCVKACPNHAIDVRGYADFAPMGHSVRVRREEEKGTISWKIKFRNGTEKNFVSPITTKPWGKFIPNWLKVINLIKERLIHKDYIKNQKVLILMENYLLYQKIHLKKVFIING